MNINQIEHKIAGTSCLKFRNSDTSVQMIVSQNRPKIADTSCSRYQKFWYFSPDKYKLKYTWNCCHYSLKVSEFLIPQSRWISAKKNLKLQNLVAQSITNSDTATQMNINKIEPKIADTSRFKYQKFWYLSPDEYKPK